MKRLTISMSDELFERLNEIENKSLFVRNIIERELSFGVVDTNERLADRLHEVEKQLEEIQSTLKSTSFVSDVVKFVPKVETTPTEVMTLEPEIAMPDLTPTEVVTPEIAMPDLTPTEVVAPEPEIAMPDLTPTEIVTPEPEIAMPDLAPSEEALEQPPFVMPDLAPAEEAPEQPPFAMPDLAPIEKIPIAPPTPTTTPAHLFEPSIPAPASPSMPTMPPQPVDKPDKMESNILMYMPHGAEIKRSIIVSLLSKRYGPVEIDAKINRMINAGTLSPITKDDENYVARV